MYIKENGMLLKVDGELELHLKNAKPSKEFPLPELFNDDSAEVLKHFATQAKQVSANTENSKFRESALAKLDKLGLTKQEVKALFG
jgi:hypothetical protein